MDLGNLEKQFVTRGNAIQAAYRLRDKELLDYHDALLKARKVTTKELRGEFDDATFERRLRDGTWKETQSLSILKSVDEQIKAAKVWRDPLMDEIAKTIQTLSTSKRLVETTRVALAHWQQAHSDLSKALADSRRPNIRSFTAAIEEIKTLVVQLRKLHSSNTRTMP